MSEFASHTENNPALIYFTGGHLIVAYDAEPATNRIFVMDPYDGQNHHPLYSELDAGSTGNGPDYGDWLTTYKCFGYYSGVLWHCEAIWSEIKECFIGSDLLYTPRSGLDAGFYEPRSWTYNRLAWPEFSDSMGFYNIMRRIDDDETFGTIELADFGDTVFVDSTVTAGHTYHYRVISEEGDTLIFTDEMSFGLQKVAGLQFPDIAGQPSMMLCDGEYLYIAGGDRIKKVDITDPYNPCVVGTRDLSFLPLFGTGPRIRDMALGFYGGYLYVLGPQNFLVIHAVDDNMPVVGQLNDFPYGPESECYAVTVPDHIDLTAYVATNGGLTAVRVVYPTSPEVWGCYDGTGDSDGLCCYAVESVGDHLYVEFG